VLRHARRDSPIRSHQTRSAGAARSEKSDSGRLVPLRPGTAIAQVAEYQAKSVHAQVSGQLEEVSDSMETVFRLPGRRCCGRRYGHSALAYGLIIG